MQASLKINLPKGTTFKPKHTMIKYFLTVAFAGIFVTSVHPQYFGLKGGLTFSNLNLEEADDSNIRTGYNLGGYVNLPLNEALAFQPELNLTSKGAAGEYDLLIFQGEYGFNMTYIDAPLAGVVRLGSAFELHGGPYLGYLTGSSLSTDGDFGEGEEELDTDDFNSLDYGLFAGAAVNFGPLQFGARYHYGLNEIADSEAAEAFLGSAKHRYVQVYAALRLGSYD